MLTRMARLLIRMARMLTRMTRMARMLTRWLAGSHIIHTLKGPGLSELHEDTAFEDIDWIIGTDCSAINDANSLCLLPLLLLLQGYQPSHVFKY